MKIKWFGHACFLLTSDEGVRILTDPFHYKVGYNLPDVEADIVTVSHGHYDHAYTQAVQGEYEKLSEPGAYSCKGIGIKGIAAFHDEEMGGKRGPNTIFTFNIDGLSVCHSGDLGHMPTPGQINEIGHVDVLLVPVGGVYTIDATGALEVMNLLKPSVTIPMHFKTEALSFQLDGAEPFISLAGGQNIGRCEIELDPATIKDYPKVIVMEYK